MLGVLKTLVQVIIAIFLFGDDLGILKAFGMIVTLSGLLGYALLKNWQKKKQAQAEQNVPAVSRRVIELIQTEDQRSQLPSPYNDNPDLSAARFANPVHQLKPPMLQSRNNVKRRVAVKTRARRRANVPRIAATIGIGVDTSDEEDSLQPETSVRVGASSNVLVSGSDTSSDSNGMDADIDKDDDDGLLFSASSPGSPLDDGDGAHYQAQFRHGFHPSTLDSEKRGVNTSSSSD